MISRRRVMAAGELKLERVSRLLLTMFTDKALTPWFQRSEVEAFCRDALLESAENIERAVDELICNGFFCVASGTPGGEFLKLCVSDRKCIR